MKKTLLLLALSAIILSANEEMILKEVAQTGAEVSKKVLMTLSSQLKSHLKKDGLVDAAKFCSLSAYDLTNEIDNSYGNGVHVKRISRKYRNMANAPREDEAEILKSIEDLHNQEVILPPYIIEKVNKNTYRYYKPLIITKGVCLKCHGDIKKGKAITTFIDETYPHDKAKGYKMNDFRGAVVVSITK